MSNPFEKRATEYLRDDEAFLAVVTPEPLTTFFQKYAEEERLYDRLSIIVGTPGSGKTTLARLFQFTTLRTLLDNHNMTSYKPLIDRLTTCRAIDDCRPTLIGGRVPLENEYRDLWELQYPACLKAGLMIRLLQARAMLTWLQSAQKSGVPLDQVEIVPRADANAAVAAIGGTAGQSLFDRARNVERSIYRISAALLPPDLEDIDRNETDAYRPFDVIDTFRIKDHEETLILRPLIIFDDAHSLHPDQFVALRHWLSQRTLRISRWVMTRLDALNPADVLLAPETHADSSALKPSREITVIRMQSTDPKQRREFRKMAKNMARRYLTQMDVFNRRDLHSLGDLLPTTDVNLSAGKRRQLKKKVDALQMRHGISTARRKAIEQLVNDYPAANSEDLRLGILAVLFERHAKRHAKRTQLSLFGDDHEDSDPNRPLKKVDAGVADGARIHLLHNYDLPYFFGIDTLCDASSENAEQFLQLAAHLVSHSETQLIRGKSAVLPSGTQHRLLRQRAKAMVEEWSFPLCQLVRRLADGIADECVAKSVEGNASLRGGPIAFGIPQAEFNVISEKFPQLAHVLQYGVAYNAFVLVPNYRAKRRIWCLIELGGVLRLHRGLTLKRGSFLVRDIDDLTRLLGST